MGISENNIQEALQVVINAIKKDGRDPIKQLSGYILSEDPTYITITDNARNIIRKLDRDDILALLISNYLQK
jgi:uncharacterized protein (UPF0297 family)